LPQLRIDILLYEVAKTGYDSFKGSRFACIGGSSIPALKDRLLEHFCAFMFQVMLLFANAKS
jgi:hypothetical protein